jgi:anti-sigma factor RsiW
MTIAAVSVCERVHAFTDGQLGDEEHAEFKAHLALCTACQRQVHDNMQLGMALDQLRRERKGQ